MKNVFIAGGAGYIGSACSEYLLDRGYKVTVFDSLVTGHVKAVDPRAEFIRQPQFENAEAIIRSVWDWMRKYPDGYQDR